MIRDRLILLRIIKCSDQVCRKKLNTHFVFSNCFPKVVTCETIWRNTEGPVLRIRVLQLLRRLESNPVTSFLGTNWGVYNTVLCTDISICLYIWLLAKPVNYSSFSGDQNVMFKQSQLSETVRGIATWQIPYELTRGVQYCHAIIWAGNCWRGRFCETDN
jgi:hypothetical protein